MLNTKSLPIMLFSVHNNVDLKVIKETI